MTNEKTDRDRITAAVIAAFDALQANGERVAPWDVINVCSSLVTTLAAQGREQTTREDGIRATFMLHRITHNVERSINEGLSDSNTVVAYEVKI